MTHTKNTIQGTFVAAAATQLGALDGWKFLCECCAEMATFSVEGMARDHAMSHTNYMAEKEARIERFAAFAARA